MTCFSIVFTTALIKELLFEYSEFIYFITTEIHFSTIVYRIALVQVCVFSWEILVCAACTDEGFPWVFIILNIDYVSTSGHLLLEASC